MTVAFREANNQVVLDEIPFRRYYGSADATSLFLPLAGAYFDLTGSLPSATAARLFGLPQIMSGRCRPRSRF